MLATARQAQPPSAWPSGQPAAGSHTDKVTGCLLGALCGDALGAAVEGWTSHRVLQAFPDGLSEFQQCRMGRGRYTDDGQMLLALAASLVNARGTCRASHIATEYANAFDPDRGYGGSAQQILTKMQQQLKETGALPDTLGSELLAQGGSYGNGGAMRVAPLGLAYRNASVDDLQAALMQTLIPTHHAHPLAVEGALAQALAVAHLSKLQPAPATACPSPPAAAAAAGAGARAGSGSSLPAGTGTGGGVPAGTLELLRTLHAQLQGRSEVMCSRLQMMEQGLQQLYVTPGGPKQPHSPWHDYFSSPAWHQELSTAVAVAPEGFQIKATDAVAAAIWACVAHWEGAPQDAVIASVHCGGDTDTIACMAGALVGARDGCAWLPQQWLAQMERDAAGTTFFNMPAVQEVLSKQAGSTAQQQQGTELVCCTKDMGREGAVVLSQLLGQLDCRGS